MWHGLLLDDKMIVVVGVAFVNPYNFLPPPPVRRLHAAADPPNEIKGGRIRKNILEKLNF